MTEKLDYDIVIVGAGPAGLSSAVEISKQRPDLSVVIIEQNDINKISNSWATFSDVVYDFNLGECSYPISKDYYLTRIGYKCILGDNNINKFVIDETKFRNLMKSRGKFEIIDNTKINEVNQIPSVLPYIPSIYNKDRIILLNGTSKNGDELNITTKLLIDTSGGFGNVSKKTSNRRGHISYGFRTYISNIKPDVCYHYECNLDTILGKRPAELWIYPRQKYNSKESKNYVLADIGIGYYITDYDYQLIEYLSTKKDKEKEIKKIIYPLLKETGKEIGLDIDELYKNSITEFCGVGNKLKTDPFQTGNIIYVGESAGLIQPMYHYGFEYGLYYGKLLGKNISKIIGGELWDNICMNESNLIYSRTWPTIAVEGLIFLNDEFGDILFDAAIKSFCKIQKLFSTKTTYDILRAKKIRNENKYKTAIMLISVLIMYLNGAKSILNFGREYINNKDE